MIIRCTKKAQKRLYLKPSDLSSISADNTEMKEWYCNVAVLQRRPYFLLTHGITLFAFWMPLAGNTAIEDFSKKMREYALSAFRTAGISGWGIFQVLDDEKDLFAKTADRRVVGSMVDYVKISKFQLEYRGGMQYLPLESLNCYLNDMPMSMLGMSSPQREFFNLTGEEEEDENQS